MADFYLKAGNLLKPIEATLTNDDGTPIDLTGATVTFRMIGIEPGAITKVDATATIVGTPTDGNVRYDWQAGETDEDGMFQGEWIVDPITSNEITVPNVSYVSILISPSIPAAPVVVVP